MLVFNVEGHLQRDKSFPVIACTHGNPDERRLSAHVYTAWVYLRNR